MRKHRIWPHYRLLIPILLLLRQRQKGGSRQEFKLEIPIRMTRNQSCLSANAVVCWQSRRMMVSLWIMLAGAVVRKVRFERSSWSVVLGGVAVPCMQCCVVDVDAAVMAWSKIMPKARCLLLLTLMLVATKMTMYCGWTILMSTNRTPNIHFD